MSRLGDIAANIFELLDESDGSAVESGKRAAAVLDKKSTPVVAAPAPASTFNQQNRKPQGERRFEKQGGERRAPRADGDRPPRTDRPAGERRPRVEGDRPPRPPRSSDSPNQEGRPPRTFENRKPRGEHGEQGAYRGGKREFDRKSGTGRGKEVQKGGAGKGGWGNDQETATHVEGHSAAEAVEELKKEEVVGEETQPEKTVDVVEAEPEEKWGKSFAEFQKERKKVGADLQLRTIESNDTAYKGFSAFKREEDVFFTPVEKKPTNQTEKKAKESSKKVVPAEQVLQFRPEKKERPPREDSRPARGGDRGGRGGRVANQAGEKRKPSSNQAEPPKLADFPSLSKA